MIWTILSCEDETSCDKSSDFSVLLLFEVYCLLLGKYYSLFLKQKKKKYYSLFMNQVMGYDCYPHDWYWNKALQFVAGTYVKSSYCA